MQQVYSFQWDDKSRGIPNKKWKDAWDAIEYSQFWLNNILIAGFVGISKLQIVLCNQNIDIDTFI